MVEHNPRNPAGKDFKVGDPTPPVDKSLLIAQNIQRFIQDRIETPTDGQPRTILRKKQIPVFSDIGGFFSSSDDRGSVILPTGSGKTVIMAELANAMYYGTEGSSNRPKTLILVPSIDLIGQTIGNRDSSGKPLGGFAKFAPDVTVSAYGGGKQDLSGDAVVMTYQSLLNAVKLGTLPQFDVVLADEAHRSIGAKTKQAIDTIAANAKTVAFTATPDFSAIRSIRDVYGSVIHEMNLREAIDVGVLSPAQVWHYKTDVELTVPTRDGDFLDEELRSLIDNEGRNRAAIELTTNYISQGLQGVIACLPGDETRHAKEMATRLTDIEIVDKKGVTRKIVAKSVSGSMSKQEREKIYEDYRLGLVDVLTYVDLLTEGWDAPNAKFIINLRPTKSPVNAIQRIGRVLRLYEPDSIAQIVEFVDNIKGAGTYTALHALGEEDMPLNTGTIFGRDASAIIGGQPDETELFVPDMDKVSALINSCRLELLNELYVSPIEKEQLGRIRTGALITLQQAQKHIEDLGGQLSLDSLITAIPDRVVIGGTTYVTPEQVDAVLGRYVTQEGDITADNVITMLTDKLRKRGHTDLQIHSAPVRTLLDLFPESGREFKAPGSRNVTRVWQRDEINGLLEKVLEPSDISYKRIYDYFHDNNGRRVPYKKTQFTALLNNVTQMLVNNLRGKDLPERQEAVRLTVNSFSDRSTIDLVFKDELLDEVLRNSKQRYIGR